MTFGIEKNQKVADYATFFILYFYLKDDGRKRMFFYNEIEDECKGAESTC
ncbi:hypothetical protein SAMN04488156_11651 [Bacillus sp. 166amftsu]|nr:hypothetical protein SAMN04488156_11651 [Bacillus sp. 166amftsu]